MFIFYQYKSVDNKQFLLVDALTVKLSLEEVSFLEELYVPHSIVGAQYGYVFYENPFELPVMIELFLIKFQYSFDIV